MPMANLYSKDQSFHSTKFLHFFGEILSMAAVLALSLALSSILGHGKVETLGIFMTASQKAFNASKM